MRKVVVERVDNRAKTVRRIFDVFGTNVNGKDVYI